MRDSLRVDDSLAPAPRGAEAEGAMVHDSHEFAMTLDGVVRRLAMARIPLTLFKLQFVGVPTQLAQNVAVAVGGTTGLIGRVAGDVFLIVDLGPRPTAGTMTPMVQRLAHRIQRLFAAAPSLRNGEIRITELRFNSDDGVGAALLLAELNQRPHSRLLLSGRILSAAAATAAEPARRLRLPPGTVGGFASASVIPLPGVVASAIASVEGQA
jgi:hypothetical protein